MQGLSLSFLWCNDITIANIYHSNRNLSKVNRAPQKDHVCVAISAIVVGRLDFKERAFYFCDVLTVLSLLHTRSYWLNICLQSKGDFEKSRSPNLLYFSACAVEASETHYSGIDRYIFPERGGIEELEDCTCIKICYLISPPPLLSNVIFLALLAATDPSPFLWIPTKAFAIPPTPFPLRAMSNDWSL